MRVLKKKCLSCAGLGRFHTDGIHYDEICEACGGKGFVESVKKPPNRRNQKSSTKSRT